MNRRAYLALAGVLAAGSGCLGTPTSCRSGSKRIDGEWTVEDGPLGGFVLTLSTDAVQRDGQLMAQLRNETDEEQQSGNRYKYDVQRRTEDGWRSIFHFSQTSYWTDEAIIHAPGTGFTWDLTLSQDGLQRTEAGQPEYFVCEPLATGSYRFVYWGITTEEEREGEQALGAAFRVSEA